MPGTLTLWRQEHHSCKHGVGKIKLFVIFHWLKLEIEKRRSRFGSGCTLGGMMSYCTMCSKISFPIQITPIWLPSSTSDQGGGVQKDSRWSEQNLHFSFVKIPEHTSSIKFNLAIGPGLSIPSTELAVRYFHSISQSLHTTSEKHCISTLCILSRSSSILKLSLRWIVSLHKS